MFRNNVLNDVKNVNAYKPADYKPVDLVKELISIPHSSLRIETTPAATAVPDYLVDRKFCGRRERHGNTLGYAGYKQLNQYQWRRPTVHCMLKERLLVYQTPQQGAYCCSM